MRADEEHRKIVCLSLIKFELSCSFVTIQEIFTLYIMGLKNRWIENGPPPQNWTQARVFAQLQELEEMIMR